jgi:hypothetical protein
VLHLTIIQKCPTTPIIGNAYLLLIIAIFLANTLVAPIQCTNIAAPGRIINRPIEALPQCQRRVVPALHQVKMCIFAINVPLFHYFEV